MTQRAVRGFACAAEESASAARARRTSFIIANPLSAKAIVEAQADRVEAGILVPKDLGVAEVDPARLDRRARRQLDPDADLRLEQDARVEPDAVGRRVAGAGVDG